jgi:anaerobic selenocysteine-containing dehydrogenase
MSLEKRAGQGNLVRHQECSNQGLSHKLQRAGRHRATKKRVLFVLTIRTCWVDNMSEAIQTEKSGYSVCTIRDIGCQLRSEAKDGKLASVRAHDHPALAKNICFKGVAAPDLHNHKDRIRKPLKRVGERGEDQWVEISYEQAMDEIAEKLAGVVTKYGPESLAVSTSGWNTQSTHGMDRRFMNALGSPNYISGVSLCAGNTAAVNKLTYGWFVGADIGNTECIVLFGHNPRKHSWTPIFNAINAAQARGAKLIVLDPRVSDQAEKADLHLRLCSGTDAAMSLGWLNVIINEELCDKTFVAEHTTGFEELCARVNEYPLERVAEITGVDAELIAEAVRAYATAESAVIPWTPITDRQISSTSAIRLHSLQNSANMKKLDSQRHWLRWN